MSKALPIVCFCLAECAGTLAQDIALPPDSMLLPESGLPEYEANIDHETYILQNNNQVINHGREIYQQFCYTCHGDIYLPGSIPNSLRSPRPS